jgi:hypothetical protein
MEERTIRRSVPGMATRDHRSNIIIHLLGQAPRVVAGHNGAHASAWQSCQPVLSDPQLPAFIPGCRRPVITLVPPVDPSKECQQDLVMSPKLYPGHLPFLKYSIPESTCSLEHTYPPTFPTFFRIWARFFKKDRAVFHDQGMCPQCCCTGDHLKLTSLRLSRH